MAEELEFVIKELAFHLVHTDGAQLEEAAHRICTLIIRGRQVYRAAGAPYGDTLAGFLIWLERAHWVTPSA